MICTHYIWNKTLRPHPLVIQHSLPWQLLRSLLPKDPISSPLSPAPSQICPPSPLQRVIKRPTSHCSLTYFCSYVYRKSVSSWGGSDRSFLIVTIQKLKKGRFTKTLYTIALDGNEEVLDSDLWIVTISAFFSHAVHVSICEHIEHISVLSSKNERSRPELVYLYFCFWTMAKIVWHGD